MELIHIMTTSEQGSFVVSARELHGFLEVKTKFTDWFNYRVALFDFVEGVEYVSLANNVKSSFSENSEKLGRPGLDYALTLDIAKELSMLERNAKGKQARQYFIEAEKQLRQQQDPVLMRLADHERRIAELEQQLARLVERQSEPFPVTDPPSTLDSAPSQLRTKVYKLVKQYATATKTAHYMVWNEVYNRLQALYGFNVRSQRKYAGETWIDVAECHGQMDRMFAIVSAELNYSEDQV